MVLSVSRFNNQLAQQGQSMTWARASQCPCRNLISGSAQQGCPTCAGKGVFWAAPVAAHAGLAGQRVQRQWAAYGEYRSGDVVVSVPSDNPLYGAGEFDRVVMLNSTESIDQVQIWGAEIFRQQFATVDRVLWLGLGEEVIDGTLPTVNPNGSLTFPAGTGVVTPQAGQQYTIQGRARLEHFVFQDLMQDRSHYFGLALPRKVVLRKFSLFGC